MRCSVYSSDKRCLREATIWLHSPDGKRNPGGFVCQEHADEIIGEYQEKLGETWRTEPIPKTEEL